MRLIEENIAFTFISDQVYNVSTAGEKVLKKSSKKDINGGSSGI